MFINVSNQLPKTSYIKMMDIWLIFNLILPFTEVLLPIQEFQHAKFQELAWLTPTATPNTYNLTLFKL